MREEPTPRFYNSPNKEIIRSVPDEGKAVSMFKTGPQEVFGGVADSRSRRDAHCFGGAQCFHLPSRSKHLVCP